MLQTSEIRIWISNVSLANISGYFSRGFGLLGCSFHVFTRQTYWLMLYQRMHNKTIQLTLRKNSNCIEQSHKTTEPKLHRLFLKNCILSCHWPNKLTHLPCHMCFRNLSLDYTDWHTTRTDKHHLSCCLNTDTDHHHNLHHVSNSLLGTC